jgi:hypothetical protein
MAERKAFKLTRAKIRTLLAYCPKLDLTICALCQTRIDIGDFIRLEKPGYAHACCRNDPEWAATLRSIKMRNENQEN